jgi:hypothetical protein
MQSNEETAEAQQTKPVPVNSSDNTRDLDDSVENSKEKTPSFEKLTCGRHLERNRMSRHLRILIT